MIQAHLEILQIFVDNQRTVLRTYAETEISRSRGRFMRKHMPWYGVLGPSWLRKRIERKLSVQFHAEVGRAVATLDMQVSNTMACITGGSEKDLTAWREAGRESILQLKAIELSYAQTLIWNLLWALDMVSDKPLHTSAELF